MVSSPPRGPGWVQVTGRKALLPPALAEPAQLRAQGSARHDPIHQLQPRENPHRSAEWEEGSAPLASTACISSLSCTPFKFRPEQHSKGITVADCGMQGNPQLHNKRDRKGCQWGSKDISTFKGCSCSQKTCSGITTVPWVQADSRAPARHSPLPGDFKARTLTGPVQGCCRVRADSLPIPRLCRAPAPLGTGTRLTSLQPQQTTFK